MREVAKYGWMSVSPLLLTLLIGGCSGSGPGTEDTPTPDLTSQDVDGDGFTPAAGDCDDTDPTVNIAAAEVCDGVDNNCNDLIDENADADGDGYLSAALCGAGGDDCDDTRSDINPAGQEACDGLDNNCNGIIDDPFDADGDGQASAETCALGTDCDDSDSTIYVGAEEICDTLDNDCDSITDEGFDRDGDGYGDAESCGEAGSDCNDSDPDINPGALEVLDGKDNDCKGGIEQTEFDLSRADYILASPTGYSTTNRSLSYVGDIDGDGLDDFVAGLPRQPSNPQYRGEAYIVFGKELDGSGSQTIDLRVDGFLLTGEDNGEDAGFASTYAGDINNDGIDDLVITAPHRGASVILPNTGIVYIIFGKTSGWASGQALANVADVTILGGFTGEELGTDVAGVGDVNNDQVDDLLIGAQGSLATPGNRQGHAYLFLGRNNASWAGVTSTAEADASWVGESDRSSTGSFVGYGGDLNGDGLNDMVIGASTVTDGGPNSANTYLIFGRNGGGWGKNVSLGGANSTLIGAANDGTVTAGTATLSPSAMGVGDVDGDRFGDLLISAPSNNRVYLVYGKATWGLNETLAGDAAGATFLGSDTADQLGADIAGIGDLNKDGLMDFVLSGPRSDGGSVDSLGGSTYIMLGRSDRSTWATSGLSFPDGVLFGGLTGLTGTGTSLGGVGDFNGDTYTDFILASEDGTVFVVTDFAY